MGQQSITEPVLREGVLNVPVACLVEGPVLVQLTRAQHQHRLVELLEVLYYRQSGICLAQPHAIREDAPVVLAQLCYGALGPILLKFVERIPDLAVVEACGDQTLIARDPGLNFLAEKFVEGLVIDHLRRVVTPNAGQGVQHLLLYVFGALCVLPQPVEPILQFSEGVGVAYG